jgi:general secretion pathway protein G
MIHRKEAFTLIEILIVVMIISILAAVIIPQYTSASEDSKLSNLKSNLQSIRAQLELYKMNHNETYPDDITVGLTQRTDSDGSVNASGLHGPYLIMFPANPFVDNPVQAVRTNGTPPAGWDYDKNTGVIVANTTGHGGL